VKTILLLIILAVVSLAALLVVVALYRHKKSAVGDLKLIGEPGEVTSDLNPEGSVKVHGELWRARSVDNTLIAAKARVRVIEAVDHLLIVEANK